MLTEAPAHQICANLNYITVCQTVSEHCETGFCWFGHSSNSVECKQGFILQKQAPATHFSLG